MKHFYLLFFLLAPIFAQSQNVAFGDIDLKNYLVPIYDTDFDNEISLAEAALATNIVIFDSTITISSFEGMQYFTNLIRLEIVNVHQSIVLPELPVLKELSVDDCFPSLTLGNSPNLESIRLNYVDNMTALNYPVLPALTELYIDNGGFTTINTANIPNVASLHLGGTQIPALDISSLTHLTTYGIFSYGLLPTFTLGDLPQLENLSIWGSNTTALNLYNLPGLKSLYLAVPNPVLDLSGCPNLLSLTCASGAVMTDLGLSDVPLLETLVCYNSGLTVLDLSPVPHLKTLDCSNNLIASLDLSVVPQLESLNCAMNQLPTINLAPAAGLRTLHCSQNQITALNVSVLPLLEYLSTFTNPLAGGIDISSNTHLKSLNCGENNLTSLDVTHAPDLTSLLFNNNAISQIDLSTNPKLYYLNASNNLLTVLDLSHQTIPGAAGTNRNFWFNSNPNLTQVNFKNGLTDVNVESENCPNFVYACADEGEEQLLASWLEYGNSHDIQVSTYCTFNPGGNYNTINAIATFDAAGDGCQNDTLHLQGIAMTIDYGSQTEATFTTAENNARFYTQTGTFPITASINNPYFSISPATQSTTFADVENNVQDLNFCVVPVGIHTDAQVEITPVSPARPGFDADYLVTVSNVGNQLLSGTVLFQYNDLLLDYGSALPIPNTQATGSLGWTYTNLQPFHTLSYHVVFSVNSPMEIPAVNIDDVLNFTATVNALATEETPLNNVYDLAQVVVGSYDPNEKICLEGDTFTPEQVGDYLHYLIRFQNSGTFPAENIVVSDVIDATKFDINSFRFIASSGEPQVRITGNKIEFIFEGINLPAEQDNEPGSHGFVTFKIKTLDNLVLGNSVSNTAEIFFDYNFPIVTNTATSTVALLGVNEQENTSVKIYPNPVKNNLTIAAADAITSIEVFDVQGRLLQTELNNSNSANIDLSQKAKGLYLIKIYTENGIKIEKILKD